MKQTGLFFGILLVSFSALETPTYADKPVCVQTLEAHGFLSRAQFQCGFQEYRSDMMSAAKACSAKLDDEAIKAALKAGAEIFDFNESKRGHARVCDDVLRDFPSIVRNTQPKTSQPMIAGGRSASDAQPRRGTKSDENNMIEMKGVCLRSTVLGIDRRDPCAVRYVRSKSLEGFVLFLAPDAQSLLSDKAPSDGVTVSFLGYQTGLIGGVNPTKLEPKVLAGILSAGGGLQETDPSELHRFGDAFFVLKSTSVIQDRKLFVSVREKLPIEKPNEGPVMMSWKAQGFCASSRSSPNGASWVLNCKIVPNVGNTNAVSFVTDEAPPFLK